MDSLRAEKRSRDRAVREETARLEREALERHRLKQHAKSSRKRLQEREAYEQRWIMLLSPTVNTNAPLLRFSDIPWPTHSNTTLEDNLTPSSILTFLMLDDGHKARVKKDVLRDAVLRFHPDKFESRVLNRVHPDEQDHVKTTAGTVLRAVQEIMKQKT